MLLEGLGISVFRHLILADHLVGRKHLGDIGLVERVARNVGEGYSVAPREYKTPFVLRTRRLAIG
jgi:hypothetical protein